MTTFINLNEEEQHYHYYQLNRHLLIVNETNERWRTALGTACYGAASNELGDILVDATEIPALGFQEISEQDAYLLAESLSPVLPPAMQERGCSHYGYQEFLQRKALVALATAALPAIKGNLTIREVDSFERAFKQRWESQREEETCKIGLLTDCNELLILTEEDG